MSQTAEIEAVDEGQIPGELAGLLDQIEADPRDELLIAATHMVCELAARLQPGNYEQAVKILYALREEYKEYGVNDKELFLLLMTPAYENGPA